jgi:hypothetical protein
MRDRGAEPLQPLAAVQLDQPGQAFERGGFPGAVAPDQAGAIGIGERHAEAC